MISWSYLNLISERMYTICIYTISIYCIHDIFNFFSEESGYKSQEAAIKQANPSKMEPRPQPAALLWPKGVNFSALSAHSPINMTHDPQQTTGQWKPKWKWKWEAKEMDNKIIKWNVLFHLYYTKYRVLLVIAISVALCFMLPNSLFFMTIFKFLSDCFMRVSCADAWAV